MKKINLSEAKRSLSALVEAAEREEPTTITKHGRAAAVVLSYKEWEKLRDKVPSFADLLLAVPALEPDDLPKRHPAHITRHPSHN
jgi:antitoxin Phd